MGLLVVGLPMLGTSCGVIGANDAPEAPADLTTDADEALVDLSWSVVDGADTYSVYRSTSPTDGAEGSALATGLSDPSYDDSDVQNGTTYYYRVTAVKNEDNESNASAEVEGTPFVSPSELEGTSGNSQIELDWSEAAGAETYNVYRSTTSTSGAEGTPLASAVSETTYSDATVENGTKYYYRVTSVNPEEEESPASGEVSKTPFSDPPDRPE